ncbi:MAG: hypothetical protein R3B68_10055 [Phycisphaerales bacterium]
MSPPPPRPAPERTHALHPPRRHRHLLAAAGLASAQTSVAIVAADSAANLADVQAKLAGTGLFTTVDVISVVSLTPTLADLQQYDSVITWTNQTPLSNVDLGDVFADYIDAGGGVVVTVFANSTTTATRIIRGRFDTDNYHIIVPAGGSLPAPAAQDSAPSSSLATRSSTASTPSPTIRPASAPTPRS